MGEENNGASLVHSFRKQSIYSSSSSLLIGVIIAAVVLGIGSGYMLSQKTGKGTFALGGSNSGSDAAKGTVVGSNDTKTFKDTAEGVLAEGGIEGEGQYHLVRPGGDSQNVYLTSSLVDLSQFVKKKIRVNGQTQKAQTAGWLMDVGRVEVIQ